MAGLSSLPLNKTDPFRAEMATDYTHIQGKRQYELRDHTGNVLATITDHKLPQDMDADSLTDFYRADSTVLKVSLGLLFAL